uniref:AB hydrolase-1 domain-containing protein n=1 Tax=Arion vulgaris TaxID=1028688 RepID=A0A0B6ZKI8_9EUPU
MFVGIIYRCIHLIFIINLSIAFTVLTLTRLWFLVIIKGPRKIFARKIFHTVPECLTDSSLGTHGYLHLEEVRIHYVSKGSDDKPLMLLLHGFPEFWYSWRFQLKEFSKNYRVVAIDQRGYGDSDKPQGISQYRLERMVKDVRQMIPALGYRSCTLVGHDWGGAVTWAFSGCYPNMVEKAVVLNCPHPDVFQRYLHSHWSQFWKSWYMFFFLLPILPEIYIGLSGLKFFDIIFLGKKGGVLTGATTQEDVEAYKYLFQTFNSRTGPINYIRAGMIYGTNMQRVTKPMLLVWGCRDIAIEKGQAELCKEYADNLSVKYIENASHWVQMDEPEQVNKYIREFLSN